MDRRTILAIALSALVLIFAPMLLERLGVMPKRQAATPADRTGASSPVVSGDSAATAAVPETSGGLGGLGGLSHTAPAADAASGPGLAGALTAPARRILVASDLYEAEFDSRGARLVAMRLKRYMAADKGAVRLDGSPAFWLELGDKLSSRVLANAVYDVSESTDASGFTRRLRFAIADTSGVRITQTYTLDPKSYLIDLEVRMDGVLQRGVTDYHVALRSWPLVTERNLQEDINNLQAVSLVGKDVKRHRYNDLRKGEKSEEGAIRWAAVRSKYFTLAAIPEQASSKSVRTFVPGDGIPPPAGSSPADAQMFTSQVGAAIVLPVPPAGMTHHLLIYAGPNDYWMLEKVGHRLQNVVDLGWSWILPFSRAILKVMVFFHQFIANYGLVILLLSALVKILFHPLTASSLRSMRAMQRIQPEVEKLRKRHEKDPQRLNQAVFALYKEHKISPFGGCLPMVIQMPVMFALYQVFLHAIELRQAPFLLWIDDLSAPDVLFSVAGFPIRILPAIMFGSSLLQQKLTPTDPRQVTTMYIMNVVMLVLFYNLPSGLVLYWTVTNLLTALQQYLVTHGERSAPEPATT